jgi:mRNA interferase MazF
VALKRGDVVIVAHGDFGKPRPAIVLQSDEIGDATSSVIVCPLTSVLTERLPIRPSIGPNDANGLRAPSQVMTDKIFAVPREHVRRTLGNVGDQAMQELDRALLVVLDLTR